MKILFRWLIASVLLFMTACQSAVVPGMDQDVTDLNPQKPSETVEVIPRTSMPDSDGEEGDVMPDLIITLDPNVQTLLQIAKEDLAGRLKISADQIQLSKIEAVTWPDSSLGCPQIGGAYLQVLTSGFRLILETGGKKYSYHTDDKDRVLFCPMLRPGLETVPIPSLPSE